MNDDLERVSTKKACPNWGTSQVSDGCYLLGYNAAQSVESQPKFGETCRLHLQGRRISQARHQSESRGKKEYLPEERGISARKAVRSHVEVKVKFYLRLIKHHAMKT
jgi:hypothetical protein